VLSNDLEEFLKLNRERFYPAYYIAVVRDKLDRLKQTGSAQKYAEAFEELVYQLPATSYHELGMLSIC
jgi:thermostable 8-oxoguanine DNA glycosylase